MSNHTVVYRFKDSKGKTRAKCVVVFNGDIAVSITGTATELQWYAAIDGNASTVGKLTIHRQELDV